MNTYGKLPRRKITGLGDAVAVVAEPIKEALIRVLPTNMSNALKNCNCSKRREMLNSLMPFNQS